MTMHRLLNLIEYDGNIKFAVRWKCLSKIGNTLEPFEQVYEDVPDLLKKLLTCRNTPLKIANKSRAQMRLKKEVCHIVDMTAKSTR